MTLQDPNIKISVARLDYFSIPYFATIFLNRQLTTFELFLLFELAILKKLTTRRKDLLLNLNW